MGNVKEKGEERGSKGETEPFLPLSPLKIFSFKNIFPRFSATDVGPQIGLARCRPFCPHPSKGFGHFPMFLCTFLKMIQKPNPHECHTRIPA